MIIMNNILKYFNNYKFKSLFFRNFILISLIVIIPFIIISVFFVNNLLKSFYSQNIKTCEKQVEKTQQQIDSRLSEINKISSKLTLDNTINNFMILNNSIDDEEITDKLKYISSTFEYIDSIYIYSNITGCTLSVGNVNFDNELLKDLFSDISEEKYKYVFIENENYYTDYITLIKPVYTSQSFPLGALFINISVYHLEQLMNSNDTSTLTFIVDENNNIICVKNIKKDTNIYDIMQSISYSDSKSQHKSYKGQSYIVCSSDSNIAGKKYISVSVMNTSFLSQNKMTLIFIFIMVLIMDMLISLLITMQTYAPITHIIDVLDQNYSSAIKRKTLYIKNQNELSYIINSLNKLQSDNIKISQDLDDTLKELSKMHYILMNSQINSHFLSNTLQSISWLAYGLTNSPNAVTESLSNLGEFYRLLTNTDSFLITLADELEYTKKYLQIMQLKYDDSFTIDYDIDNSVLSKNIPKLSFQPIIENSFVHGFDLTSKYMKISISVHKKNNDIEIVISDNGIGMSELDLKNLKNKLKSGDNTSKIGLSNINNRFKLIFGEQYGITVFSEWYNGTSVHLTLPNTDHSMTDNP